MFVDIAKIFIKAGNGGDGCVSFRREKYISAGGPDGGDGGDGGAIVVVADVGMRTLMDFKYKQRFIAQNGESGKKKNMRGKTADDLVIKVPAGTVVRDFETGRVVADLREGRRILLPGGSGGKGNARFATPTRQTPGFATPGRETKGRHVVLELKTIADVGLIGYPNVGKSTLLAASTSARPKIASYHFTTLTPNLGVVHTHDGGFVMADIPGLIEGAHKGSGLGHDFLRHIERTRLLIHVVDASCAEGRDIIQDYNIIRNELRGYSKQLNERKEIVAVNKMDIPGAKENARKLKNYLSPLGIETFEISAATGKGIGELLAHVSKTLGIIGLPEPIFEDGVIEEWALEKDDTEFEIVLKNGVYYVQGEVLLSILKKTNPDNPDSMRHFQKLLVDFGIIKALRKAGVKTGDSVNLEGYEFEFID